MWPLICPWPPSLLHTALVAPRLPVVHVGLAQAHQRLDLVVQGLEVAGVVQDAAVSRAGICFAFVACFVFCEFFIFSFDLILLVCSFFIFPLFLDWFDQWIV